MRTHRKTFLALLAFVMIIGPMGQPLLAWESWKKNDPITDEWNMLDLLVARPLGVAAAIAGVGVFSVSLPFTITVDIVSGMNGKPPSAVRDSAEMFMLKPLKFSFTREFPDENM